MPRLNRCVLPGVPYHLTQRGVDRRPTFHDETDRKTYVNLLREYVPTCQVQLLAWCVMTNHIHLIAIPGNEHSLGVLARRVHGRYAQYFNARWSRTGHLWQNRFFACALGSTHLWAALAYVERNPVRAKIAATAEEYLWSSAEAHLIGQDVNHILDMGWWLAYAPRNWQGRLLLRDDARDDCLRRCTFAGRPYGDQEFLDRLGSQFGRHWTPGRPKKPPQREREEPQRLLFGVGQTTETGT